MKKLFSGYILAGGKSSRMKRDKAFLKIGEKTFVENAVEILEAVCEQTKIVLNKSQTHFIQNLPDQISHIFDIYENRGALGGIHAAFKDCETEFALILAVDLPFVTSEVIKKMCEIAIERKDFAAVVPRQNDGRLQPLAAVYRVKDCLPKLEKILTNEKSPSVRNFLNEISANIIEQKDLSDKKELFFNVNNPTDFQQIND